EGEVEIAKRIEEGEGAMVSAVLGTPHALYQVLALGPALRAGELRLRDLVQDEVEDDGEAGEEDERLLRRFLAQLGRGRRIALDRAAIERRLGGTPRLRRPGGGKLAARHARLGARLVAAIPKPRLNPRPVERIT